MTAAQELGLRATYLDDMAESLREHGDRCPNGGRAYFNAATSAARLAQELRELVKTEGAHESWPH